MDEKYCAFYGESKSAEEALGRLIGILSILRKECPWDKVQTHESLRICMLEEAYELCDAIDRKDTDNMEEELGDVLLQVLFHSAIAGETSNFSLISVINRECDKLIRRHPHVFSKENAKSVDNAIEKWENVKWKEKGDVSYGERLSSVPRAMPALIRSYKVQNKAAEAGYDRDDMSGAFRKLKEEAENLAAICGDNDNAKIYEGLGNLLFAAVGVSRLINVNPEQALNAASDRFIGRFARIEAEDLLKKG